MNLTNFSLLSALYNNGKANLYNEIYFPIIKYSLQNDANKSSDGFSTALTVQESILEKFDISIPQIIIEKSIRQIGKDSENLVVFDKGSSFKLASAWHDNETLDFEAQRLSESMQKVENEFKSYLEIEDIECKYSFVEFFSDHTEDLLKYLNEGVDEGGKDAEVSNMMRFVKILEEKAPDLYETAQNFFWASVVAAFLKRDQNVLNNPAKDSICYLFDTSLVMGCLNLSSEETSRHSLELKQLITQSGNRIMVHPMTIREIKMILDASSQNGDGPDPSTQLYEAYARRNLNQSDLLIISSNIRKLILEAGFEIDNTPEYQLDKAEKELMGSIDVKRLAKIRSRPFWNKNDFREIHDVYMRNFIRQSRKKRSLSASSSVDERYYFVTSNRQLINHFYLSSLRKNQFMISPDKIVTELWINGALSSNLKLGGLSENVSRCLAANKVDARRRMNAVIKCSDDYIENETVRKEFCHKAYFHILRRSNRVLENVDLLRIDMENTKDSTNPLAKEKSKAQFELVVKIINTSEEKAANSNYELSDRLTAIENKFLEKEKENNALHEREKELENQIKQSKEREEKDAKLKKLQGKLSSLKDSRIELETKKSNLTNLREQSVSNTRYYIINITDSIFIFGLIAASIWLWWNNMVEAGTLTTAGTVLAFYGALKSMPYFIQSKKEEMREKQRMVWERNNPELKQIRDDLVNVISEIRECQKQINAIDM